LILHIVSVFPQQGIGVLSADAFGRGDVVPFFFQPGNDLLGGLIGRFSPFSVEFSQDFVQTDDADL